MNVPCIPCWFTRCPNRWLSQTAPCPERTPRSGPQSGRRTAARPPVGSRPPRAPPTRAPGRRRPAAPPRPRRLERRRRRERGAHRAPIGEPDAPRVRARAGAIEGPEALGVARGACHLGAIGAARAAQPRIHHRPPERLGARLGRQQRARHRMRLATQLRVDVDVVLKEVEPPLAAARVTGPRA